ncbi:MAG: integrase [Paracoccus denitrificans]|uniref:Integrase n=1 Tax=Paracoccus denitrificans TaxID=266 RepID=A0A533HZQ4_PARDE|nr:MAG: integrase [Paracoccus denitrificans]
MPITKRGKTWHLRRRVPKRYRSVDRREAVYLSLHTDSETVARQKEPIIWQEQINSWEARLAGNSQDAEERYEAALNLARLQGLRYLPAAKVAELPREALLERIELVRKQDGVVDKQAAAAALGGVSKPPIRISRALDLYWGLARDKTVGMSADQEQVWANPRKKAIKNLIAITGDKPISEITADDMLDFRDWWMNRITVEGLSPGTANKDLTHLGDVLGTVNSMKRLGLTLPMSGLSFKEMEAEPRIAYSDDWIRNKILAEGALDGLNDEARAIVLIMINTGARPSEICRMRQPEILLDDEVPHLCFAPIGRRLKTRNARRRIPLLGVALEALRQFPEGILRYREKPVSASGCINSYFTEDGLRETEGHSLYSLRHNFEDRMLEQKVDERIRRDILGHALGRERYGQGGSLQFIRDQLAPIAF